MNQDNGKTVNVCSQGREALSEPNFLIRYNGKFYLTLAVLEYDPNAEAVPDAEVQRLRDRTMADIEDLMQGGAEFVVVSGHPLMDLSIRCASTDPDCLDSQNVSG